MAGEAVTVTKRSRRLPVFLQSDEPERLLRATGTQRDRLMLLCMGKIGLRVSEVVKLKICDLDFGRKLLWVRRGKGDRDRCLPLAASLSGPLRGFCGTRPSQDAVFPSPRGGHLTTRAVQLLMKRVAKKAGMSTAPRAVSCHKLRHSFCTRLLDKGTPIHVVMQAMGHQAIATTQIYAHCAPEQLRACMDD
jgi:integrase/recombinase XerD